MSYILKKYSELKPIVATFIDKIIDNGNVDIDEQCELLLTAKELNLEGRHIETVLNKIASASIDDLNLITVLIRQFVLLKYNILEAERKQFIKYWLYDEFYKAQNFITVSVIYWIAIEDMEFLSENWKDKLPKKVENLEKNIKSIVIRAWLPYYLERFNKVELAKSVASEILSSRDRNGSWSGNIEKTLKISYALSCSKTVKKETLQKSIEFLNNRIMLGINFNVKNCSLILKLYYKLNIIALDLVKYIQDNIDKEKFNLTQTNSFIAAKNKVFVSYSHTDTKWLNRVIVHLKPLERQGLLEIWSDKKILAGKNWEIEIENALNNSAVAILLISADFLASDFINNKELPILLTSAMLKGTTIIPLIVSHSLFSDSILSKFQAINSPDKPLVGLKKNEQEKNLTNLALAVNKYIAL